MYVQMRRSDQDIADGKRAPQLAVRSGPAKYVLYMPLHVPAFQTFILTHCVISYSTTELQCQLVHRHHYVVSVVSECTKRRKCDQVHLMKMEIHVLIIVNASRFVTDVVMVAADNRYHEWFV
jgi:hypothetical protein